MMRRNYKNNLTKSKFFTLLTKIVLALFPYGALASHSPMEQFTIKKIIPITLPMLNIDISFTNSSLSMIIGVSAITSLMYLTIRKCTVIPGKLQMLGELIYNFITGTLVMNTGKEGLRYFPLIFTVFMYILSCNLAGLMPYGFTATSHIIVTFAMALFILIFITAVGLYKNGLGFFRVFLPSGLPVFMMPLMIVIELFAYLARAVSLSIRLAANMLAGHTMMKVVAMFIGMTGIVTATIPFGFLTILNMFEFFIAILQAYIFTILSCVYLDSVLHIH